MPVISTETLSNIIFAGGIGQLGILFASALVPFQLDWNASMALLPRLHRQLFWVYGGYVVLAIVACGLICLFNAAELAAGGGLARAVCGYISVFWGVRLALQAVLDARPFLTNRWLTLGYHALTAMFLGLTIVFAYAALHKGG